MNADIVSRLEQSFTRDTNTEAAIDLLKQVNSLDSLSDRFENVINNLNKRLDEQQKYIEQLEKNNLPKL